MHWNYQKRYRNSIKTKTLPSNSVSHLQGHFSFGRLFLESECLDSSIILLYDFGSQSPMRLIKLINWILPQLKFKSEKNGKT